MSNSAPDVPRLPARPLDAHKGDFGRVVLIGGSPGMAGAVSLAGMAALRSGAGLVQLLVSDACQTTVAAFEPSYMAAPVPADDEGRISLRARSTIAEHADRATALACGPGLGRSQELNDLVDWIYTSVPQPVVLDADALNALSEQPELLGRPGGVRILTPHPGEFRRLMGSQWQSGRRTRDEYEAAARELAARTGVVVVLKGHRTLITDGRQQFHNTTGNPGMATGGTGDVLTGVLAALLGQALSPQDASRLGVYVHGLAGDLAAQQFGETSLIASDLLRFLPQAFLQMAVA